MVFCESLESYEGLNTMAAQQLAKILEKELAQWAPSYPIFRRITVVATLDVTQDYPQLYTEPYQILDMLHWANRNMKAVVTIKRNPLRLDGSLVIAAPLILVCLFTTNSVMF